MMQLVFTMFLVIVFSFWSFQLYPPDDKKWGGGEKKILLASLAGCTPTFKNVAPPLIIETHTYLAYKKAVDITKV